MGKWSVKPLKIQKINNFQWHVTELTLLGIHFSVDLYRRTQLNYDKVLIKITQDISKQKQRKITPTA